MTNFDPNMKKKISPPKIEAGHVLMMFLFFPGFQPGCSYKRCSYKKKGVEQTRAKAHTHRHTHTRTLTHTHTHTIARWHTGTQSHAPWLSATRVRLWRARFHEGGAEKRIQSHFVEPRCHSPLASNSPERRKE